MISAVDFLRYCSCGDFPGESPKMVLIIEVFENGEIRIDGKSDSRYSASSLRRHFSAEEGKLTTILVGKDGGSTDTRRMSSRSQLIVTSYQC